MSHILGGKVRKGTNVKEYGKTEITYKSLLYLKEYDKISKLDESYRLNR